MTMKRVRILLILVSLLTIPIVAEPMLQEDLENEIRRVRKELVQVQNEREKVSDDTKADRKEFDEYRKRTLTKMRSIRKESDSIRTQQITYQAKLDSLNTVHLRKKRGQKNYNLRQEQVRTYLVRAIDTLIADCDKFSPSLREKPLSALKLLRTELSAKSVDNVESINRLFTVLRELDNGGSTTQIVQGTSPIPEIRGTSYRLRIGTIMEAVVNAKGTIAAVWTEVDEEGVDHWKTIDDIEVAAEILKAVNVREGKALPRLVALPFDQLSLNVESESIDEK